MTTFQIVMLVGAAGLIFSLFWPQIRATLISGGMGGLLKPNQATPETREVPVTESKLVDRVFCWESLRIRCDAAGLKQAVTELDKVFPLLIIKDGGRTNV